MGEYEVGIYVNSSTNSSASGQSTTQYVRLTHLLNCAGIGLLTDNPQTLKIINTNKIKINKIALLVPMSSQPKLPKKFIKIYKKHLM